MINLHCQGGQFFDAYEARQCEDGAPQVCPKGCLERVPLGQRKQQNRLVEAKNLLTDQKLTFAYDYQGRRVKKTVFDGYSSSIVSEDIQFVYEGWNMILEVCDFSTFVVEKVYMWGMDLSGTMQGAGGVGGLLSLKSSSTALPAAVRYYYTYDANGNVSQMINGSGIVVSHYEYSPFGKVLVASGAGADDNRFRFSTKYEDRESGLNYYGFRYYDAELGRWLNRDPIKEDGGENLYVLLWNRALDLVDVLGLSSSGFDCCSGVQYRTLTHDCCSGYVIEKETECCENSSVVDKETYWVCKKPLRGFNFGPISHSAIHCTDPNTNPTDGFGKYPSGSPLSSPGEIRNDGPPNPGDCDEMLSQPSETNHSTN